jgi:hypothetical protein
MTIDWDDSSLLIGNGSLSPSQAKALAERKTAKGIEIANYLEPQIKKAHNYLCITHFSGFDEIVNYIVIEKETKAPVTIIKNYDEERTYNWVLNVNFDRWEFVLSPVFQLTKDSPSHWGMNEFIREMSFWGVTPDPEDNDPINRHYAGLTLWLMFDELPAGRSKDLMREILYCTKLIELKPCRDLSLARRMFAKQLYPLSELAQRAESEDHLWFCLEYSDYLMALPNPDRGKESKEAIRTAKAEKIRYFRKAKKAAIAGSEYPQVLTIDQLQKDGKDWRQHIEDLLLSEAVKIFWEYASDNITNDLKHHYTQYLSALAHHNAQTGHSNCFKSLSTVQSKPAPRGKGRPPKGSHVKNY